jgi:formylglycine-generating enzyme required for sulfatase activity
MIQIPAATFIMGSDDSTDERPPHSVSLEAFLIDETEVTQQEYQTLMGVNPSILKGDGMLPVENITWYDAVMFCNARSTRDRLEPVYRYTHFLGGAGDGCAGLRDLEIDFDKNGFRLPTEAEWEYACRAGTATEYYWGNDINGDYAWHAGNSEGTTHPVGQKKPNAWGLYDMSGNVWEWCNDLFDKLYYSSSPKHAPKGAASGLTRAVRGGSWNDTRIHHLRCCARGELSPERRSQHYGFRCVAGVKAAIK